MIKTRKCKAFFYNVILLMIFWNIKYLFYNFLLLLLCCVVSLQFKRLPQSPTTIPTVCGHRYFTESCKNIIAHATITDIVPDGITDRRCKFQYVRLPKCQVTRPIYRQHHQQKLQIQCARALTPIYRQTCRRTSKIVEGFLKFQSQIQKISTEITDGN